VHLATLQGTQVIYLEKLPGLHPIGLMSSRVGDRSPAHCTGLGKALLAYVPEAELRQAYAGGLKEFTPHTITRLPPLLAELERVRREGFAVDDEEHEQGVVCVAAPVFDTDRVVAAISASGPADRIRKEMRERGLTQAVLAAAAEISARLGRVPTPAPAAPRKPVGQAKAGRSLR
jgi:IclR family acetate operon transcriptional repressor